nr:uncharacterized protein LOC116769173 [Danaus plexippus plexippus]
MGSSIFPEQATYTALTNPSAKRGEYWQLPPHDDQMQRTPLARTTVAISVTMLLVRREGQDTITLKSGNLLLYREGDQQSQGVVGFLVHKSLVNNIITIDSVSSRVAYLTLRVSKRYSLKVVQVYTPTSSHPDEEVESMYENISRAIHTSKTHFNVVLGDFNVKLGKISVYELKKRHYVGPTSETEFEGDSLKKRRKTGRRHISETVHDRFGRRLQASGMGRTGHQTLRPTRAQIENPEIVQLGRSNFEKEVNRRIQIGWAAFVKLRNVF